jgi:hypothetical protein
MTIQDKMTVLKKGFKINNKSNKKNQTVLDNFGRDLTGRRRKISPFVDVEKKSNVFAKF